MYIYSCNHNNNQSSNPSNAEARAGEQEECLTPDKILRAGGVFCVNISMRTLIFNQMISKKFLGLEVNRTTTTEFFFG